jgi:uncharacterized membrane protein YedE/YeeE
MKRGGLCTYAAVLQIIHHKRLERMMLFLGAAAWSTLAILPLYWFIPNQINLTLTHHHLFIALIGGIVLGIGAFLNKGCFFGTFVQLVSGNLNYLATLVGLSTGVIFTRLYLNSYIPATLNISDVAKPNLNASLWLTGMAVFALFMVFSIKLSGDGFIKKLTGLCTLSWHSSFAMIVIGIGGGLLYGTVNGWNYADVLANTTAKLVNPKAVGSSATALISTIAMVIGGIVAAVTAKEFTIRPVRFLVIASCFIGGILMGTASLLIPGGNDGLLLKGIPGFAQHAFIGYLAMIIVMLLLVYLFRRNETN